MKASVCEVWGMGHCSPMQYNTGSTMQYNRCAVRVARGREGASFSNGQYNTCTAAWSHFFGFVTPFLDTSSSTSHFV